MISVRDSVVAAFFPSVVPGRSQAGSSKARGGIIFSNFYLFLVGEAELWQYKKPLGNGKQCPGGRNCRVQQFSFLFLSCAMQTDLSHQLFFGAMQSESGVTRSFSLAYSGSEGTAV